VSQEFRDHRLHQDGVNDLDLTSAVLAVLHRPYSSRIHRKTPDQSSPNLPLLNARSWPLPGFPSGRNKLIMAGKASTSSVSSLAWPRTHSHGQELTVAIGTFHASRLVDAAAEQRDHQMAATHR
jgi:hypothetical protein